MKSHNTFKRGSIRYIVFKEKGIWYAVALELNIVEAGKNPQAVLFELFEAVQGYIESTRKAKMPAYVLNQTVDPEYEAMWSNLEKTPRAIKTGQPVYTFGRQPIAIS